MVAEEPERQVPVVWVGLDEAPIQFANQFAMQGIENELILTIGQIAPPMLLGTDEERRQQIEALSYVPVKTVCRVSFTPERLGELIDVLTQHRNKRGQRET
jgi:hypothetical protein